MTPELLERLCQAMERFTAALDAGRSLLPELAMDDLLEVEDVAARLKVSPRTVQRLVKKGKINQVQVSDRRVGFRLADVERYLGAKSSAPKHGRRNL